MNKTKQTTDMTQPLSPTIQKILESFREKFIQAGEDPSTKGSHKEWYSGLYIDTKEMEAFLANKLQEIEGETKLVMLEDENNAYQQVMGALSRIGKESGEEGDIVSSLRNAKNIIKWHIDNAQYKLSHLKNTKGEK